MFDFDLDAIDTLTGSCAGADLKLLDVQGLPFFNSKGAQHFMTLMGPDAPQYQRTMHSQTMQRIQAAAAAKESGKPVQAASPEEAKAEAIEVMAACVKAWNFLDRSGEPIPVSVDAARALLTRFPVIYEQVDAFITRRVNFLPVSPKA